MKEEMRTIGYLCPACRKRVIQSRSVFALSASGAVVSCECGESSLTIDAEENKFRLCVPCGVCGGEHTAPKLNRVLSKKSLRSSAENSLYPTSNKETD